MKTSMLAAIAVFVCVALVSFVAAQTPPEKGKASQDSLPREACQALESYIANIDVAKSQADPSKRAQLYQEARAQLEPVLKRYGRTAVLEQAYLYADYTEQVVTRDATDPLLNEAMEKRLKLRAGLLASCADFTATR